MDRHTEESTGGPAGIRGIRGGVQPLGRSSTGPAVYLGCLAVVLLDLAAHGRRRTLAVLPDSRASSMQDGGRLHTHAHAHTHTHTRTHTHTHAHTQRLVAVVAAAHGLHRTASISASCRARSAASETALRVSMHRKGVQEQNRRRVPTTPIIDAAFFTRTSLFCPLFFAALCHHRSLPILMPGSCPGRRPPGGSTARLLGTCRTTKSTMRGKSISTHTPPPPPAPPAPPSAVTSSSVQHLLSRICTAGTELTTTSLHAGGFLPTSKAKRPVPPTAAAARQSDGES